MKNFALIGVAGYIAPRHLEAIKQTGNNLVAALDKHDAAGVLDSYFPQAHFFTEFERFDRHLEKMKRQGQQIDYLTICSPNYLHDSHIRFGLRIGADVICEKPMVLNPWNAKALMELEKEMNGKVNVIQQLRLHPAVISLKETVQKAALDKRFNITLRYITPRGNWYHASWKGDIQKSGGIATNIGIHFFDVLMWIFGNVTENKVSEHNAETASGSLTLERADVEWFLSINANKLPGNGSQDSEKAFRSISIDGQEYDFSKGFADLHLKAYEDILAGRGLGITDIKSSIELVYQIRNAILS